MGNGPPGQRLNIEGRLTPRALRLFNRLSGLGNEIGLRLYLVGGPVRDLITGRPLLDIDIAVEGDAAVCANALATDDSEVVLHPEFNSATLAPADGSRIDITGTRIESYPSPGALPIVALAGIGEDLRRRDFSVNAMALALSGPQRWYLIDPHGGYEHLRRGVLAALHPRSFIDDPTRVLRAARFAARLCLHPEASTESWVREAIARGALETVSRHRLLTELRYLLVEPTAVEALALLGEWGGLEAMGLAGAGRRIQVLRQLLLAARAMAPGDTHSLFAAGLGILLGPSAAEWTDRWPLTAEEREQARFAARMAHQPPEALFSMSAESSTLYRILKSVPPAGLMAAWAVGGAPLRANLRRFVRELAGTQADISGDDLILAGFAAGPEFKSALAAALDAKLDRGAGPAEQLQAATDVVQDQLSRCGHHRGRQE